MEIEGSQELLVREESLENQEELVHKAPRESQEMTDLR